MLIVVNFTKPVLGVCNVTLLPVGELTAHLFYSLPTVSEIVSPVTAQMETGSAKMAKRMESSCSPWFGDHQQQHTCRDSFGGGATGRPQTGLLSWSSSISAVG